MYKTLSEIDFHFVKRWTHFKKNCVLCVGEALCVLNSAKCSEFPPELVLAAGVCDMFALICSICLLILSLG